MIIERTLYIAARLLHYCVKENWYIIAKYPQNKKPGVCGQRFSCNWLYRITQYVLSCAIVPRVVAPFLWSRELSFLLTPTCGLSRSTHASDHFMNHSFLLSFWLLSSRLSSKLKWRHFRRIWPATELLQCNFVYCVLKCIGR